MTTLVDEEDVNVNKTESSLLLVFCQRREMCKHIYAVQRVASQCDG